MHKMPASPCPIPGHAGWGLEQSEQVESAPANGRGYNWMSSKVPSNPNHSRILLHKTDGISTNTAFRKQSATFLREQED